MPGRRLQVALLALSVVFISVALARNRTDFVSAVRVDTVGFVGAIGLCLFGLVCLGSAWALLHPPGAPRAVLIRRFLLAQPAKYIPGGVSMPASQIVLSKEFDSSATSSVARLVTHSAMMVCGGLLAGSVMILERPQRGIGLMCLLAGVLGSAWILIADVGRLVNGLIVHLRRFQRARSLSLLPDLELRRPAKAFALVACAAGIAALSSALPLLGRSSPELPGYAGLVGAFAFAWTVGFLAVPFPAGAGIREGALAVALTASINLGSILALALMHRVAMLAAETVGFAASVLGERRAAQRGRRDRA
jgi:glycosyltransferase 2 family protein